MKAENEAEKDNKALVSKKEAKGKKRKVKSSEASTSKAKVAKEEPPPKATSSGRVSKAPERYTKVIDEEANAKENSTNKDATANKESNNKTEDETSTSKAEVKKHEKTPEKEVTKKEVKSPMPQEVKSNHDLKLNYPGVYALNRIQMLNRAQILKDKQRRLSVLSNNSGNEGKNNDLEDDEDGEETAEQFTEWFPPDTWSYLHQVTVTDVTVGDVTATMREASSPEGFFNNPGQSLSNPSA